jgi:ribokinase
MTAPSILVIGSSNTDMVIKTENFPKPGETLLGGSFFMFPGGKGANQAVAAARLGGHVTFIAKVGYDVFGQQALQQFKKEKIRTEHIITDYKNPSGVALITVNGEGENTIVVAQGANGSLLPDDLSKAADEFKKNSILLMQLETPIDTIVHAAKLASSFNNKVILNPAPAATLPDDLYQHLYLITPNRSETQFLTGVEVKSLDDARTAARQLHGKGVPNVVITLGSEGAHLYNEKEELHIPSKKVTPIDTTAAGDIFNGALAVSLGEGASLKDAVKFANNAAALSVTKMGAQSSAPYRKELK